MPKRTKQAKAQSTSLPATKPQKPHFPAIPPPTSLPLNSVAIREYQIIVLPNFLSSEACKLFLRHFSNWPLIPTPPPGKNEATRTNSRLSVQDPQFAKSLYCETGLEDFVSGWTVTVGKREWQVKGLHSNIRIYRYEKGQFFGPHYDSCTRDAVTGYTSHWTLLVYLTGVEDGLEGGEIVFHDGNKNDHPREIVVPIERGSALLHRHSGGDCLLHEARPVINGTKWVLRSDVVFG